MQSAILVVSILAGSGKAYTTFKPICTLPPPDTNFVSGPNTRSTLAILTNCLSIILLCTWSIQRLKVPAGRTRNVSFLRKMWWIVLDSRRKIKWMLWTILMPELLVGMALNNLFSVRYGHKIMKQHGWEKIHVQLANIGYFVLHFDESLSSTPSAAQSLSPDARKAASSRVSSIADTSTRNNSGPSEPIPLYPGDIEPITLEPTQSVKAWSIEDNSGLDDSGPSEVEAPSFEGNIGPNRSRPSESIPLIGGDIEAFTPESAKSAEALSSVGYNALNSPGPPESIPLVPVLGDRDAKLQELWNFEDYSANLDGSGIGDSKNWTREEILWKMKNMSGRYWVLDAHQWEILIRAGVAYLPEQDARRLENLDHGGTFVKVLAILQVSYLMVQLAARKVAHLPSTQLEIAALAFAASSFLTNLLWWNKPQDVESIQVVEASRIPLFSTVLEILDDEEAFPWDTSHRLDDELRFSPMPNSKVHNETHREYFSGYGIFGGVLLGGVLFGSVHCLAWNFVFPTEGEAIAWRVCSVIVTALPIVALIYDTIEVLLIESPRAKTISVYWKTAVGAILYIPARLFLIVEPFRALFYLPPEAFIETWAGLFLYFMG